MFKKLIIALLAAALCLPLCACSGGEQKPSDTSAPVVTDTAPVTDDTGADGIDVSVLKGPIYREGLEYDYDLSEYITLPDCSALELDVNLFTVTDEDVQMSIDAELTDAGTAKEVDRPARTGDRITYISTGFRTDNGEEFESKKQHSAIIGSEAYLVGFTENLIGAKKDDVLAFNYDFPDDFYNDVMAGMSAAFSVTVLKVEEITPAELTDEYVAARGIDGVSTAAQYFEYMRARLQEAADLENAQKLRDAAYDYIDKHSVVSGYPEKERAYYENECDKNADAYAKVSGVSRESYIEQTYGSPDAYRSYVDDYCATHIKKDMITLALAREYDVTVSREQYVSEMSYGFTNHASEYGIDDLARFEELFGGDLTFGILLANALDEVVKAEVD